MSIPLISQVNTFLHPITSAAEIITQQQAPLTLPDIHGVIDAWHRGKVTGPEMVWVAQTLGIALDKSLPMTNKLQPNMKSIVTYCWDKYLRSTYAETSETEARELLLRKAITPQQYQARMLLAGIDQSNVLSDKTALVQETIKPGEMLEWSAKLSLDASFVTLFGLAAGYNPVVEYAYEAAGIQNSVLTNSAAGPIKLALKASEYDWINHWHIPGVADAEQFRIRLRPSFANAAVPRDPSGLLWSPVQHDYAMYASAIPASMRPYYDAAALRPLPVRHLHAMFDMGLVNQTDLAESFGDEGYSQANSAQLASEVAGAHRQHLLLAQEAEAVKILTAAWLGGTIPDDTWRVGYYRSTLSNAAAVAAYDALPQATQVTTAQGDGLTSGQLSLMIMERATKNAAAVVESTKRRLMESHINFGQAIQLLQNRGLTTDFISVATQAWAEEFNPPHKELQTGELMEALRRGWITQATAVARLQLLGWLPADIAVLLSKVGFEVSEDVVKAATLAQRQVEQQHQAALALQKQAASAAASAKRAMLAHGTPAELMGWAKKKIITVTQYRNAMLALGEQTDLIDANVQEIQQSLSPKPAKPARVPVVKPPPPPKPSPEPTVAEITAWVKKGIIQLPEYESRLAAKGYSAKDIADFVAAL